MVIHSDMPRRHGTQNKDDGLVLGQRTGERAGVVKRALHGEAVALAASGQMPGDGVFDHLQEGGLAVRRAHLEFVQQLDCRCVGKEEVGVGWGQRVSKRVLVIVGFSEEVPERVWRGWYIFG